MSDQFLLCRCGEQVEYFGFIEGKEFWYCSACQTLLDWTMLKIKAVEYFSEEVVKV